MPTTKRTFLKGRMNLDIDERLLQDGEYGPASNIRVSNSEGSDVGAIEKSLSNKALTTLSLGANIYTLGSLRDEFEEKIYWAVLSDNGCYIIEHEVETGTTTFVLQDTRVGVANVLGFVPDKRLQMALIVDSDNDNRLLAFTDNNTQPKCINVERAKTYGENGFDEEMILLIKKPPLFAPTISLGTTPDLENNLEEKFIRFSYRYKYLDGEYSALSPASDVAFGSKTFSYDYAEGVNQSMVNTFNTVNIGLNTGSNLVTDIEIVYKESAKNTIYLVESFNKVDKGWGDNVTLDPVTTPAFTFTNNKIYRALPEKELYRLYDNVPLLAKAIAVINNRIVFGNYTENFNITDCGGDDIEINLSLDKESALITDDIGTPSVKSNRDYEISIVYLDDYGRMTTALTSENNTIHIPINDSVNNTQIKVNIAHEPPCFAKYYRFFIKQNKIHYNNIMPSLFYEDGQYRWIKLDKADKDKIKEGDYLIVKSDSASVLTNLVKTKVLEISDKEKNFLQPEGVPTEIIEKAGLYFKINPKRFTANTDDYYNYTFKTFHNSASRYHDALRNPTAVIYPPSFYGTLLNDMTISPSSSLTLGENIGKRYIIQIDDTSGINDTFQWSDNNGASGSWTTGVEITAIDTPIALNNGISVQFENTTGHSSLDEWNFYASGELQSVDSRAYGWFRTIGEIGEDRNTLNSDGSLKYESGTFDDEIIENGAVIDLTYREYGHELANFDLDELPPSNNKYDNIMEWYYRENIGQHIIDNGYRQQGGDFDINNIFFMRSKVYDASRGNGKICRYSQDGFMTMIFKSQYAQGNWDNQNISAKTSIFQSGSSRLVFETDALDDNQDIYNEIGQTYAITDGYHIGNGGSDIDQAIGVDTAEIILPFYNCYAWGNAVESYRIKDGLIGNQLLIDTRPTTTIENYRQNKRIASYTYSNVYEQTTNYNALNEFNLGLENYNDLDDKYGGIQAMVSWDNDLDVWQEDKVTKVLYDKSVIYNKDGSSNLAKSDDILKNVIPYAGEYGISTHPESLAVYGNYTYWADAKRGAFVRKGQSGIEVISNFGIRDWTRDNMTNLTTYILGCYDPYFGQYVVSLNGYTLTFNELGNAWTSFHSWIPDEMVRINNRFFSFKDGQLYLHNDSDNAQVNNFYGVKYSSTVETIINEAPSEDKIFKNIIQESTSPWKVTIETNLSNGTIEASEFNQRESKWFAHTRKNESASLNDRVQGIGNIVSINANEITFGQMPTLVSIGETLYQLNTGVPEEVGVISDIQGNVITVSAIITTPVADLFAYSVKDARVQGGEIRGYYAKVTLENDDDGNVELFAINSNIIKSYSPTGHK